MTSDDPLWLRRGVPRLRRAPRVTVSVWLGPGRVGSGATRRSRLHGRAGHWSPGRVVPRATAPMLDWGEPSSHETPRWRGVDSNHRYRVSGGPWCELASNPDPAAFRAIYFNLFKRILAR